MDIQDVLAKHKKWCLNEHGGERADLRGADLQGADLQGADLQGADLRGADLRDADLRGADLQDADLRDAHLQRAHLRGAHLQDADLRGADLQGADLRGADLRGAAYYFSQCPESGSFTAWKKCRDNIIVKLLIPASAKRSSATSRKCRANQAKVVKIYGADIAYSQYDATFSYKEGETVKVADFCEDRWKECTEGVHFFITREEAEQY